MVLKLSKEQGEQIRALHAAGKGRNEITRMLGLTSANVTNFCKANGLTFTSSKSLEVARESRSAEMRAREIGRPMLVGTPDELVDVVAAYREAGVDELIVPDFNLPQGAAKREIMDTFIEQVAAGFRG